MSRGGCYGFALSGYIRSSNRIGFLYYGVPIDKVRYFSGWCPGAGCGISTGNRPRQGIPYPYPCTHAPRPAPLLLLPLPLRPCTQRPQPWAPPARPRPPSVRTLSPGPETGTPGAGTPPPFAYMPGAKVFPQKPFCPEKTPTRPPLAFFPSKNFISKNSAGWWSLPERF